MLNAALILCLRCPACGARLRSQPGTAPAGAAETAGLAGSFACTGAGCGREYPVERGVPILLDEARSLFSIEATRAGLAAQAAVRAGAGTGAETGAGTGPGPARRLLRALTPAISRNVKGRENYARLLRHLREAAPAPRVLVVGGGLQGAGMEALLADPAVELLQTDVVPGARTELICDAHGLPFADGSFDAVVAQAMLEHVLDPVRCVAEIHRVLRPRGLVYAETPFMQQVHEGRHDFTRFTHLGHRRLFRHFEELDSGAVGGPGMALAWAYRYFLWSLTRSRALGSALTLFASLTSFWMKWLDGALIDRPRALDGAAGVYFLGRRSETTLDDRELIAGYRGAG
jgi:SAM-dependent methyltransferase